MYYIITDKSTERMVITKSYTKIFSFITENIKSKVRTIDINVKPLTIDRRVFLKDFLEKTKDNNRFFELTKIMIKQDNNLKIFLRSIDMLRKYEYYELNKNNVL